MLTKIEINQERADSLIRSNMNQFFKTGMNFIQQTLGFKRKKLHLVIGTAGGGKSTLRNTIIIDFLKFNPDKRIFIHLSEESKEDFEFDLAGNKDIFDRLHNLYVFSEQDNLDMYSGENDEVTNFVETIIKSECDLFLFDNITTSFLYGDNFSKQGEFSKKLKGCLNELDCSMVVFAHTSSEVKEGGNYLIDKNHIRGSKAIVNLSEFMYILQSFHIGEQIASTLRIVKHRATNVDKKMFVLPYDSGKRIYKLDFPVDFKEFNGLYNKQNKLGKP